MSHSYGTNRCRDFESDFTMIILGIAPSITARKGNNARKKFVAALVDYFKDNGPETGSDLIKARWEANQRYSCQQYAASFEIANLFGVLINAVPTFFWMLLHIYSRPTLLEELRTEIAHATQSTITGNTTTRSIIVSKLKEYCPLLFSSYKRNSSHSNSQQLFPLGHERHSDC